MYFLLGLKLCACSNVKYTRTSNSKSDLYFHFSCISLYLTMEEETSPLPPPPPPKWQKALIGRELLEVLGFKTLPTG